MRIVVTGATGFIGNHVVLELLKRNFEVIAVGRNKNNTQQISWINEVEFIELDIKKCSEKTLKIIANSDKLIHLAWEGVSKYKELFHFEVNLMPQYFFLKRLIALGLNDMTVSGTCFEYGMSDGCVKEDLPTNPNNPYAIAKDSLRRFLEQLQTKHPFYLKWVRLFYMYGEGQSKTSILSQLGQALKNQEEVFNMSGGEQLRDYLPVKEVANNIIAICLQNNITGTINCCSGKPISIKDLVENYLKQTNQTIRLNLGYYPYSDIEPMAFWGDNQKIKSLQ